MHGPGHPRAASGLHLESKSQRTVTGPSVLSLPKIFVLGSCVKSLRKLLAQIYVLKYGAENSTFLLVSLNMWLFHLCCIAGYGKKPVSCNTASNGICGK